MPSVNEVKPSPKDNTSIVTPYAFSVSEQLLNTPLAHPFKRLLAITIDLLFIVAVSSANTLAWGLLGVACIVTLVKNKDANRWVKALLLLLIGLITLFAIQSFAVEPPHHTVATEALPQANTCPQEGSTYTGVVTWAESFLVELGLGISWAAAYFSFLTAYWHGQTVGKKLLGIQVVLLSGKTPTLWEAFVRYGGYGAGLSTGLLGFLQIYWDPNRQTIQDKVSETLVIRYPGNSLP